MKSGRNLPTIIMLIFAWCALEAPGMAARLLDVIIDLDGRTVLRTAYQDNGTAEAPVVWRYLRKEPLWAYEGAAIHADADNALIATLRGRLTVRVQHVERTIIEVTATELTLIRQNAETDWHLPAAEVERIAKANEIPDEPPLSIFVRANGRYAWLLAGALGVAIITWLVVRPRWRRST